MNKWLDQKAKILLIIFIFIFSLALRFNAPRADLPSHITFSGSILTDEGNQCHNSRSKALFNEWYPDDWRITNYNPILPYIKYFVFKTFGVGLLQLRSISYLFAFISLLFFFLTLNSYFRNQSCFALLGTSLLGMNFIYLMYNKIGTYETSIIFWVILTLYFIEKYRTTNKKEFLILAGATTSMAFVFKNIMAYFIPLPFATLALFFLFSNKNHHYPLREALKNILFISLGILLVYIPWYVFHYLPNKQWISSAPGEFMGNLMFPKNLKMAISNFLNFPWQSQFHKMPVIWLGAVLYVPIFYRRLLRKNTNLTEVAFNLFLIFHTAVFFVMSYRPTRYFIPVIPIMVFLTILFMNYLNSTTSLKPKHKNNTNTSLTFLLDVIWISLASNFCFLPLISRFFYKISIPQLSPGYLIITTIVVVIFHTINKTATGKLGGKNILKIVVVPVTILLVLVSLYINIFYYIQWNTHKKHSIRDISMELKDKLENAYIGGLTAPVAVLENQHKALWLYPNFVNWESTTFEKYPLTHALLGTDVSNEINHHFSMWPKKMDNARLLKVYPIKNYSLHLYSFVAPYIKTIRMKGQNQIQLLIVNPSKEPKNTCVGKISISENNQPKSDFMIEAGEKIYSLNPGEDTIDIEELNPPSRSMFCFLIPSPVVFKNILRYEGEHFAGKTGFNQINRTSSQGENRSFDPELNKPGFLIYGPSVPFSRGILIADFKIKFKNLKTKIRPVCHIDIFSLDKNIPLAKDSIKPTHIKTNKTHVYRLSTSLFNTQKLEFRLKTTAWADVSMDYLELTYLQGCFIKIPEKNRPTPN